jgi:hypothetical protein
VELDFIELLYVNAQPLYKVNIIKRKPIEGLCNWYLPLLNKERKLVMSVSNVDPQSSSSNLLARRCNHLKRNEM